MPEREHPRGRQPAEQISDLAVRLHERMRGDGGPLAAPADVAVVGPDHSMASQTLPGNASGPGAQAGAAEERATTAAELKGLRRELNTLVSVYAGRLGRTHGAIHSQLRNACGGPPVPMASADQIRDRISMLRSW